MKTVRAQTRMAVFVTESGSLVMPIRCDSQRLEFWHRIIPMSHRSAHCLIFVRGLGTAPVANPEFGAVVNELPAVSATPGASPAF